MMRTIAFAARSLVRQPGRSSLGILGIAAVGALLFDMLLLSRGLVVSFRDLLDSIGFDVRVTATDSPLPAGIRMAGASAAAREVAAVPGIAEVVPMRTANGELLLERRVIGVGFTGMDPGARRPWTIVAGRDLTLGADPPALVVNETLMAQLGLPLGADVRVRVGCDSSRAALAPRTFRLAGVAQFPFDDEAQLTAVMTRADLRRACGDEVDDADMLMVASTGGAARAVAGIKAARPDLYPVTNEQIVARVQTQGFTYFRQISAVLSTITLLFGFLLITVLLTVSVNQRLAEIAALRALGFSRVRAAADVLAQGAMLVGAGGVLALPLGLALSVWLDRILKAMPGIPAAMHFFVFEPRALVTHAALLVVTALLASAYPMWLVARLPIATTLRNEVVG
ncbi:MAG TPA: FtsX-like permease family protein [Vicinamibacterales bacterium]|nr:FtsX-like permease family protein [Vicinamibacterales bacterium]